MTNSATTKTGDSLLQRIATHERALLADVAHAREDAQAVIEGARAEARALQEEDDRTLGGEALAFRRDAETARVAAYAETVRAAEGEAAASKGRVTEQAGAVAREIIAMIVPGGSS